MSSSQDSVNKYNLSILVLSCALTSTVGFLSGHIIGTQQTAKQMQVTIEHYKAPIHGVVAADANTLCKTHGGLLRLERLDKPRMWDVQCGDSAVFHDVELVKDKVSTDDVLTLKDVING